MTTWIWDASALHHAAAADRLDVLVDIARNLPVAPTRLITTALVADELTRNGLWHRCVPHLEVIELDSLAELTALTRWLAVVSHGSHSRGEATVFAWAEVHGAVVVIDDSARLVAQRAGLDAHGTLWILAEAIRAKTLLPSAADALVEALRSEGARLPRFPAGGIEIWARQHGLLPMPRRTLREVRPKRAVRRI